MRINKVPTATILLVGMGWQVGCERDISTPDNKSIETARPKLEIEFPPDMQADDATVNLFLRDALQRCVDGDYDAFRALWVAQETPPTRREYEAGWQLAERARILRLSPFREPESREIVYAVRARLELDEERLRSNVEATREIVLLLVRVEGEWRLKRAPGFLRERMMAPVEGDESKTANHEIKSMPGDRGSIGRSNPGSSNHSDDTNDPDGP
jgi:hypothetical protein